MSISSIQGSSTNLTQSASPVATGGGSKAEQAYRTAVKQLSDAQKKLTQDASNHVSDQTIQLDNAAVTAAAAAVATAAMAVAREQQQSQQTQSATSAGTPATATATQAASKAAPRSSATGLDVYA